MTIRGTAFCFVLETEDSIEFFKQIIIPEWFSSYKKMTSFNFITLKDEDLIIDLSYIEASKFTFTTRMRLHQMLIARRDRNINLIVILQPYTLSPLLEHNFDEIITI